MNLNPAEEAMVRAFVVTAKRDRLLGFLANPKRRADALDSLSHFNGWDERFVRELPSIADVVELLTRAGAPGRCYVISEASELDGREMSLNDAVEAAEAYSFASVLCCVPGRLACFFDEIGSPRRRLILWR